MSGIEMFKTPCVLQRKHGQQRDRWEQVAARLTFQQTPAGDEPLEPGIVLSPRIPTWWERVSDACGFGLQDGISNHLHQLVSSYLAHVKSEQPVHHGEAPRFP